MKFQEIADNLLAKLQEKEVVFNIFRDNIGANYTAGELVLDLKHLCFTLEDKLRGFGEKVNGETCIPAFKYHLSVSMSNRFKKLMPIVYTEKDKSTLKANGVTFAGVRLHGGNTVKHSEGCPLIAYNRVDMNKDGVKDEIQGSATDDITELIQYFEAKGYTCYLNVENNALHYD